MELVKFLTARLDEDETAAEAAQQADAAPWSVSVDTAGRAALVVAANGEGLWDCEGSNTLCMTAVTAEHVGRHDPRRVLAEVAAKRQLVHRYLKADRTLVLDRIAVDQAERHGSRQLSELASRMDRTVDIVHERRNALRVLAVVHSDHPDYDPAWRPVD